MGKALPGAQEVEELLQFLYLMPVAVVRLGPHGALEMLTPQAVHLLHELEVDVRLADGARILEQLSPGLAQVWRASAGRIGTVMPALRCTPKHTGRSALHLMLRLVRPDARCTMLVIEDVTTTVEQEREITRQRRRLGVVLDHIHGYCAVMLDMAGTVSEWNPSIGRMLGSSEHDIVGQPLLASLPVPAEGGAAPPNFAAIARTVAQQGWCQLHSSWRRSDGRVLWGDCVIAPVVAGDGSAGGYVAVIRDVTEEHWRTQKLLDAALIDPLTGLYNRRGFAQHAEALRSRFIGAPAVQTWIMVDIDDFKAVNDDVGHDGGDAVLKAVAAALQGAAREGDLLARFGGEEFVLLLPDATAATGALIGERLRGKVAALSVAAGGRLVHVTASFGIAEQRRDEAQSAVLERADEALYRAKTAGRNRVVVDTDSSAGVCLPPYGRRRGETVS